MKHLCKYLIISSYMLFASVQSVDASCTCMGVLSLEKPPTIVVTAPQKSSRATRRVPSLRETKITAIVSPRGTSLITPPTFDPFTQQKLLLSPDRLLSPVQQ